MRRLVALLLTVTLAVGCTAAVPSSVPEPQLPSSVDAAPSSVDTVPLMQSLYYQPEGFAGAVAQPADYVVAGRLRGGLLPHHLLASDMIAGWWREAGRQHSTQPYEGILLVSPSHFPESCGSDLVTTSVRWRTHIGDIQPDSTLVATVLADKLLAAEDNPQAVEQDHGAAGHVPFIRHYLPDVPLTVCLLSNKLSGDRLRAFWALVSAEAAARSLLVVASVDCSHYLDPVQSSQCDTQTIAAINERNRGLLLSMTDRNVDSPQSVTTLLAVADTLDGTMQLLGHSTSQDKLAVPLDHVAHAEGLTTYMAWALTLPE